MGYFNNKNIWITGASSGIGRALSLLLSKEGAALIISSRSENALKQLQQSCAFPTRVQILPLDLGNHDELERKFMEHEDLLKNVDILINNGGISQRSKVEETQFSVYKQLMDVNYFGAVQLSLLMLPYFLKRKSGHFVVMSSMAGKFGVPFRSGYSASKMALHGFFDALRAEITGNGVYVSLICPGFVKTDISKNAMVGDGSKYEMMDEAQSKGMNVDDLAKEILHAVRNHKEEAYFGGLKEVRLAIFVSRLFPSLFRKIIAKAKVK